jgi:hypothetical protein
MHCLICISRRTSNKKILIWRFCEYKLSRITKSYLQGLNHILLLPKLEIYKVVDCLEELGVYLKILLSYIWNKIWVEDAHFSRNIMKNELWKRLSHYNLIYRIYTRGVWTGPYVTLSFDYIFFLRATRGLYSPKNFLTMYLNTFSLHKYLILLIRGVTILITERYLV